MGASQNVTEALCIVRNITEHYGVLPDVKEVLRIVTERYGSVTELLRNIMEPLRRISSLPITN